MAKKRSPLGDLPAGVGVYRTTDGKGTNMFRVRLGSTFTGGSVVTKSFVKLSEAKKWIFGDAQKEQSPVSKSGVLKVQKVAGQESLLGGAAGLHEAMDAIKRCKAAGITLADAVTYAIKHMRKPDEQKTLQEVCDFVLKRKKVEGASEKHLKGMKSIFTKVCEDLGATPVQAITREKLETWQDEQDDVSLNTRISYARHLNIAFNEAVDRGWSLLNPVEKLKRSTEATGDVQVWTPADLVKFLAAAVEHEPKLVAGLVVKAFGGLRTSELLQLEWKQVYTSKIQILGKTAKTRRIRAVTMSENLMEWLKDYRPEEPSDLDKLTEEEKKAATMVTGLTENGWHDAVQRVCEHAGLVQPSNVLRHSYGTCKYHLTQSETETAYQMGNTPGVVIAWYTSKVVEDADVQNWWKITPEVIKAYAEGRFDLKTFKVTK